MKIELENAVVYQGSNLDVLPTLPDNSVDSIVTDPPYELGFMGKKWDSTGIAYSVELWQECLRVLKPGGHLLAFGGSRTWHRLAVAIEDAGFEMRDSIAWLYGSGFPKSMNISKSIEAKLTTGSAAKNGFHSLEGERTGDGKIGMYASVAEQGFRSHNPEQLGSFDLEPTTDEAKQWQGWGTALKPAFEPVVVARKPLEEKTVAANVLKFGTGGLNIDGTRISYTNEQDKKEGQSSRATTSKGFQSFSEGETDNFDRSDRSAIQGRWPANIILDPYTAELLDEQSGQVKGNPGAKQTTSFRFMNDAEEKQQLVQGDRKDVGGASRFFYVAKASKKDRNEGLEQLESQSIGAKGNGLARTCATCGAGVIDGCKCPDRTFVNPERKNFHPTVKPTTLMEYLIKLVTPPNGIVLDPFTGSGSTGKAALLNGFQFIGIELTEKYLPIIEGRLKWANEQVSKEKDEVLF